MVNADYINNKSESGFLENRGQMMDTEGKPVPHVLFKTEATNLNLWVTSTGITFQTLHLEEKQKQGDEQESDMLQEFAHQEESATIHWERIDVELKGANIKPENIVKEGASETDFNYFYHTCPEGIYSVKEYKKIIVKNVYPNIDWLLYRTPDKGFKYDFVVHEGGNYKHIELLYKSKSPVKINPMGELEGYTQYGNIKENKPVSFFKNNNVISIGESKADVIKTKFKQNYQKPIEINGNKGYETSISFELPAFSSSKKTGHNLSDVEVGGLLIIDPQLVWATFYGGDLADGPMALDTDNNGNLFATGYTVSTNFPTLSAGTYFRGTRVGTNTNAAIWKYSNIGVPLWVTYYGGNGVNHFNSIVCDNIGNIFITGHTESISFPLQNASTFFQPVHGGGFFDVVILKFSNAGVRLWATYYGGGDREQGNSIACDNNGNIVITGTTQSANFPTLNPTQLLFGGNVDAFILKFSNTGVRLWATYYGGSGGDYAFAISFDQVGNIFVTGKTGSLNFPTLNAFQNTHRGGGYDVFFSKFGNAGNLLWSTYYGGLNNDEGVSIACDKNGNLFATGITMSPDFPLLNNGTFFQGTNAGNGDAYILKFNNTGSLLWSTYYGGSNKELQSVSNTYDNLAVDSCGNIYISIHTLSTDLPFANYCTGNSYAKHNFSGGSSTVFGNVTFHSDAFISLFSNNGILMWNTYLGGDGNDFREPLAVDNNNNLFVSGEWTKVTSSASYPITDPGMGAYYDSTFNADDDAFFSKFTPLSPTITQQSNNSSTCACTGAATITINCATPPYNFIWNNGVQVLNTLNNTHTITELCAGNYQVEVNSNCTKKSTRNFTIVATEICNPISVSVNSTSLCISTTPCPTITATGSGGTQPYTYTWNMGASTQNINPCPLTTTTYTVTVKDNTGTTATSTATVTVYPAVTTTTTAETVKCNGTSTGSATATGNGGTSPYTYSWSNLVSGSVVSGLAAGSYTVTITDNNGCTATSTTTVVSPTPLIVQFTKGTATCSNCGCKEWVVVNATGGTMPYSYLWVDGYDKRYKNKICPGSFTINIKDKNGCSVDVSGSAP